ncbi:MAG: tRNA dihydrouridine synthase DusB [Phycisphaerae bacterium]|nr:tRNA dihydrouridine synthase DusB [Phycisphaerae bacterium]
MDTPALQIGRVKLATPLLLAPMVGYCELPYRLVVRATGGVGLTCTSLLCPQGVLHGGRGSMAMAALDPRDRPVAMQFFGDDPALLADACRWAADAGADIVDLNMGCPADKITQQAGGSDLLRRPADALRIVERMIAALGDLPLTAKLRLGWDDDSIVAPWLATRMEQLGVAAITIHGRTTQMQFSGRCRLDGIAAVVSAVSRIPVVGNGDVKTPADAARMLRETGCRGVMVGRGALGQPWIFRDIWSYLSTGETPPPPTLAEKCQFMREHFAHHARLHDERSAVNLFRKQISWYGKYLVPCRVLKDRVRAINSATEFEAAIEEFLRWRESRQDPPSGTVATVV